MQFRVRGSWIASRAARACYRRTRRAARACHRRTSQAARACYRRTCRAARACYRCTSRTARSSHRRTRRTARACDRRIATSRPLNCRLSASRSRCAVLAVRAIGARGARLCSRCECSCDRRRRSGRGRSRCRRLCCCHLSALIGPGVTLVSSVSLFSRGASHRRTSRTARASHRCTSRTARASHRRTSRTARACHGRTGGACEACTCWSLRSVEMLHGEIIERPRACVDDACHVEQRIAVRELPCAGRRGSTIRRAEKATVHRPRNDVGGKDVDEGGLIRAIGDRKQRFLRTIRTSWTGGSRVSFVTCDPSWSQDKRIFTRQTCGTRRPARTCRAAWTRRPARTCRAART